MIFQNKEKTSSSHLFDVRDAITGNGPIRRSQFLEEKKWPPRDIIGNQGKDREIPTNIARASSSSQPLANQIHQMSMCADAAHAQQPSRWNTKTHIIDCDSFEPEFEPPFRLEVTSFS